MKKILTTLALGISLLTGAQANTCGIVIDFPPGGTSDAYVRAMQKNNPDIQIEYKTGGFGANAINLLNQDKNFIFFTSPGMYGSTSPIKDPPLELLRIIVGAPILALTNKPLNFDSLLKGKVNIGVPALNTSHHMVALQLKSVNPNIEVIPTGGDNKALPMVKNGDLDLYLVSATAGTKWVPDFGFSNVFTLFFNKPLTKSGVTLHAAGFNGAFVHRDATPEQRIKALDCISKAVDQPSWKETLINMGAQPIDLVGPEKDKAFANYLRLMKKEGL